jgi:hypothetical protein
VDSTPDVRPLPRTLWRLLAASPLPLLALLWALWPASVYMFDATGLQRVGGRQEVTEWAFLTLASVALVVSFWLPSRSIRVLGYTFHSLVLALAFGVAGVEAVTDAFGGPDGNAAAPAWALAALSFVAALCVAALLATAALIVEDVRAGEEEP